MDLSPNIQRINQSFEERETQQKAQKLGLPYVDLVHYPLNPDTFRLLSKETALKAKALPFYRDGFFLKIATTDPNNKALQELLEEWKKEGFEYQLYLCSETSFRHAIQIYESHLLTRKTLKLASTVEENIPLAQKHKLFKQLEEKILTSNTQLALNTVELTALQVGASDIHFQPYESFARLRFRLNGLLTNICDIPRAIAEKMIQQIKYKAGMKSNITTQPQDGHFSATINNRIVDFRVSTLPTKFFESVVIRVLDSKKGIRKLSELGFNRHTTQTIESVLKSRNGMILVTGPTGSGKTTSLYAMLSILNTPEKKLVSLEDPIEYHLDNVTQSQVNPEEGFSFDTGLRSILRHDPDVILVGEVRDEETAKLAIESSLTGHLVLTSLHTNSAIGAVTRLRNLNVKSFNIASGVKAVFAQRLVRVLCSRCKKISKENFQKLPEVSKALESLKEKGLLKKSDPEKLRWYQAVGCEYCAFTGYESQSAICEHFVVTKSLAAAIARKENEIELEEILKKQYPLFTTLFEDGLLKALKGETSIAEIYRVVA